MHDQPRIRRIPGFTLVEVLIALFVMAIMAGMAWRGVDGIVRSRDAAQSRLEQTLRLNTVMAQWEQDLASVQDSSVVPQALSCDGATVRISRRTASGMQIVAWSLRPDAAGAAWVRWAGPSVTTAGELQQSWLHSLQLQDNEPGALRALTGLEQWQVYFFQQNGWANCQSTGDVAVVAAPAAPASGASAPTLARAITRQGLPKGVRVVLTFGTGTGSSGMSGDLTRDIQLGP